MQVFKCEINPLDIYSYTDYTEDLNRCLVITDNELFALVMANKLGVDILEYVSENDVALFNGTEEEILNKIWRSLLGTSNFIPQSSEKSFLNSVAATTLINGILVLKRWEVNHPNGREVKLCDLVSLLNGEQAGYDILEEFKSIDTLTLEKNTEYDEIYQWFKEDYFSGKSRKKGTYNIYEYTGWLRDSLQLLQRMMRNESVSSNNNSRIYLLKDIINPIRKSNLIVNVIQKYSDDIKNSDTFIIDIDSNILNEMKILNLFKGKVGSIMIYHDQEADNQILKYALNYNGLKLKTDDVKQAMNEQFHRLERKKELKLEKERALKAFKLNQIREAEEKANKVRQDKLVYLTNQKTILEQEVKDLKIERSNIENEIKLKSEQIQLDEELINKCVAVFDYGKYSIGVDSISKHLGVDMMEAKDILETLQELDVLRNDTSWEDLYALGKSKVPHVIKSFSKELDQIKSRLVDVERNLKEEERKHIKYCRMIENFENGDKLALDSFNLPIFERNHIFDILEL